MVISRFYGIISINILCYYDFENNFAPSFVSFVLVAWAQCFKLFFSFEFAKIQFISRFNLIDKFCYGSIGLGSNWNVRKCIYDFNSFQKSEASNCLHVSWSVDAEMLWNDKFHQMQIDNEKKKRESICLPNSAHKKNMNCMFFILHHFIDIFCAQSPMNIRWAAMSIEHIDWAEHSRIAFIQLQFRNLNDTFI